MMSDCTAYNGPRQLSVDVSLALTKLNDLLSFGVSEQENHSLILINGLDRRDDLVSGIAVYLVGSIASCIDFNLVIRAALFDEHNVSRDS